MTYPSDGTIDADAALLLMDPSPALRYRVLTELLDVPLDDPEVADLAARRRRMPDFEALQAAGEDEPLRELVWRLCRLAHLGFGPDEPGLAAIADRIFELQDDDGSWPLGAYPRGPRDHRYTMIPLQASLPLRGLAAAGYATDRRTERGYEWLLAQRLEDGAWPLGEASGQPGYIAGYRKLPGSKGCRVNTEGALAALVLHPERRTSDAAHRALDLLLQRETRDEWAIGTEIARLVGAEEATGFVTFYARFDLAFVLELASRGGASIADQRIADLVAFLADQRAANGLWEHPTHPELSRWLTFEILSSLRRVEAGDWAGGAPKLPFRAYPVGGRWGTEARRAGG